MNPLKRGSSPMASSVNWGIRNLGKKLPSQIGKPLIGFARGIGKRFSPILTATGVFTGSYNYAIAVQCSNGMIRQ